MRASVRAAFVPFTAPIEGVVPFLYLDVRGLVTTAIGCLVDPVAYAMVLPFKRLDGSAATREEIAEEWHKVKFRQDLAHKGGMAYRGITSLRLTQAAIDELVGKKLDQIDDHLSRRFVDYASWPADAQLALLSQAWAIGPAFNWPMLVAALRARDFIMAANEAHISEHGNPGVAPRNRANRVLWRNAAYVLGEGLDPEPLYWPRDLFAEDETQPELPSFADPEVDRESKDHHVLPSLVPTVESIGEAIADVEADRRKSNGEG